MTSPSHVSWEPQFNAGRAAAGIEQFIRLSVTRKLHRRGVVLGVSGGVDSAVCVALAARALSPHRVFALLMPDRATAVDSLPRASELCNGLGIAYRVADLTPTLDVLGCYRWSSEAIRELIPDYSVELPYKITIAGDLLERDRMSYFNLVVEDKKGRQSATRMPSQAYLRILAATNMKQRLRKLLEFSYADALNYAVLGTANRLEHELGFFVRGGDGLADLKPIAHLLKSEVYALASHLCVPESIRLAVPSTDTYPLAQGQDEFFFGMHYSLLDSLLIAESRGLPAGDVGRELGLRDEQVERVYRDIRAKRRMAYRLDQQALMLVGASSAGQSRDHG